MLPPIPLPDKTPEIRFTKMFINNEWVDSVSGKTIDDVNPATEQVVATVPDACEEDVDAAVRAAACAFDASSSWRRMDASDRGALLNKLADLIDENKVYLACLE